MTCSTPLAQPSVGRPRSYCSAGCRQAAYERRRRRTPRNDWHTPPEVRTQVLDRWPVTLDAAACATSALVDNYLGLDHPNPDRRDALAFPHWADLAGDGVVFLNPPYLPSNLLGDFLTRAVATAHTGTPVVGLLPASTGTAWWWRHVVEPGARVEFLRGRLAFTGPHARPGQCAPWSSAIVEWRE